MVRDFVIQQLMYSYYNLRVFSSLVELIYSVFLQYHFKSLLDLYLNAIQDGLFQGCQKAPYPKICHIYPTMLKLATVTHYLKKIQKIYESCDAALEF